MLYRLWRAALTARVDRMIDTAAAACAWAKQFKVIQFGLMVSETKSLARLLLSIAGGKNPGSGQQKTVCSFVTGLLLAAILLPSISYGVTPPGTVISNTASATYDVGAAVGINANSNTDQITSTVVFTASTISFYQYSPSGVGAVTEITSPSSFANGAAAGPFVGSANPTYPNGTAVPTVLNPAAVDLVAATGYHQGEPVFVRVDDINSNIDAGVRDTVLVTLSNAVTGDTEVIQISETGVNTGIFIGYIQTVSAVSANYDGQFTIAENSSISASYTDAFDGADISNSNALADPFGIVFDSATGLPVDGAIVSIVNAVGGTPATVFGDDGFSAFPDTVTSGGTATDGGGKVYNFPAGGYRFPFMVPGDYRIIITPPAGYAAPSGVTIAVLQTLPGAPFALDANASFGNNFTLNAGPPLNVDIPADPSGLVGAGLALSKNASRAQVAIGDFVQYTLDLANLDGALSSNNTTIADVLPTGFRYRKGSTRLDGSVASDPAIASNGRDLTFSVGTIVSSGAITLTYVAEVTAGAPLGGATNTASASNDLPTTSNIAQATVTVDEDLFRSQSRVVGRVTTGSCQAESVVEGEVALRLQSKLDGDVVNYIITVNGNTVPVNGLDVQINLPDALGYVTGSARGQDGKAVYSHQQKDVVWFDLGEQTGEWGQVIQFAAKVKPGKTGLYSTRAIATFNTPTAKGTKLIADNTLQRQKSRVENQSYIVLPKFGTRSIELSAADKAELDSLAEQFRGQSVQTLLVSGHTDSVAISKENKKRFSDNYALSLARARSVGNYLKTVLSLKDDQVKLEGYGPDRPVADNQSSKDRTRNRRVEINVTTLGKSKVRLSVLHNDSGLRRTVTHGPVNDQSEFANVKDGIPGIRLVTEDGTYVVTDKNGMYHFEGLQPGTHVIQIDKDSLPDNLVPFVCEGNTRFAGSPDSQFIDTRGGTLWRADFHLQPKTTINGDAALRMQSTMKDKLIDVRLDLKGRKLNYKNLQLRLMLPEGMQYVKGSSVLGRETISDPDETNGSLVYPIGSISKNNWHKILRLRIKYDEGKDSEIILRSKMTFDVAGKSYSTPEVENTLLHFEPELRYKQYTFRPRFESIATELGETDKVQLDKIIEKLRNHKIDRLRVIGHTDNTPLSKSSRRKFNNNTALSRARAAEVARYVQAALKLDNNQIEIIGMGPGQPVADNTTEAGRVKNRRVDISVGTKDAKAPRVLKLVRNDKTPRFSTGEYELNDLDRKRLDNIVRRLGDQKIRKLRVVGHSDSRDLTRKEKREFKDNYSLSQARARSMANYLATALNLSEKIIETVGMGPASPIADNATEKGRNLNRRVELFVSVAEDDPYRVMRLLRDDSGEQSIQVTSFENSLKESKEPDQVELTITKEPVYDLGWLQTASTDLELVSPKENHVPPIPVTNVVVKHHPGMKVTLMLNGQKVNPLNYDGLTKRQDGKVAISKWRSVPLDEGDNKLEAIMVDVSGKESGRLVRNVHYANKVADFEFVKEKSQLVADGKQPIRIAVRLLDQAGYPVRAGVVGEYSVNAPYTAKQKDDALQNRVLSGMDRQKPHYLIGPEGIAYIELSPSAQSGTATVRLQLGQDDQKDLKVWLTPAQRDWILVGLAEGTVGYNSVSGNMEALKAHDGEDEFYSDGRVAFYAKGSIKGKWLMTAAYDTDKSQTRQGNTVHQLIDPDKYYTLYGDASEQRYDAPSTKKLYVKLEREQFYVLFGDYDTGMTVTELSRYSRTLTGLKTEFSNEHYDVNAFVAETDQTFVKDEIRGEGVSGLYRLSQQNIVINSEKVTIETRDRFQSQTVLSSRTLTRHIDYSIDSVEGTIYFREPIFSKDANFNPIYIVVDYETINATGTGITAGARGALKTRNKKAEIGVSVIHEGVDGDEGDLVGADVTYKLTKNTEVRAEVASSEKTSGGTKRSGDAYLAELSHKSQRLEAKAYVREQQEGFGVGQQKGSETGTQKVGAEAAYKQSKNVTLNGEVWHEENLSTTATRDVINTDVTYRRQNYSLMGGFRHAQDTDGGGVDRASDLITAGATRSLFDHRLGLRANTELAVGDDANPAFPSRFIVGADYNFWTRGKLFVEQEYTQGENQDSETTRVGLASSLWQGAHLSSSVENQTNEYGPRTFANMGLTQGIQINEHLNVDFGIDRTKTIRDPGDVPFNVNVPPASGTVNNDFTAYTTGATYRQRLWSATTRFELRTSELEDKDSMLFGFYRQQTSALGIAVSLKYFDTERIDSSTDTEGDIKFSLAYRPLQSRWIMLNRLDYAFDTTEDASGSKQRLRKVVDNFNGNYQLDPRNQMALQLGVKHTIDTFDADEYEGNTYLLGTEYRHDLSQRWDFGGHLSTLYSANANNYLYSWGLDTGWSPARNLWVSFGYNFDGYEDKDFTAAGYTAQGPYVKFRFALDYQTARDVMAWWEKGRGGRSAPAR